MRQEAAIFVEGDVADKDQRDPTNAGVVYNSVLTGSEQFAGAVAGDLSCLPCVVGSNLESLPTVHSSEPSNPPGARHYRRGSQCGQRQALLPDPLLSIQSAQWNNGIDSRRERIAFLWKVRVRRPQWPIGLRDFIALNAEFLELSQVRSDRDETTVSDPHKQRGCEGGKTGRWPLALHAVRSVLNGVALLLFLYLAILS